MLYLHIGLHKTGTTFLQEAVWPFWKGLYYAGKPYGIRPLEGFLNAPYNACLFSNEHFTTAPTGDFMVRRGPGIPSWAQHRQQRIERLYSLLPNASIILGLRRQPELVRSLYSQYLVWGGYRKIEEFVSIDDPEATICGSDLLFAPLISEIIRRWDRVFLFDSRELHQSLDGLVADLGAFFQLSTRPKVKYKAKRNERISEDMAEYLRCVNRQRDRGEISRDEHDRILKDVRRQSNPATGAPLQLPENIWTAISEHTEADWDEVKQLIDTTRSRLKDQASSRSLT